MEIAFTDRGGDYTFTIISIYPSKNVLLLQTKGIKYLLDYMGTVINLLFTKQLVI